jgi:complex iron-sulfur molybdoenzyme family reductase subunit gamma
MEWPDSSQDRSKEIKSFPDSSAVMFPLGEEIQTSTLMMGFLGKANIWHWKADHDAEYWLKKKIESKAYSDFNYPFEEEELFIVSKEEVKSAVNDLMAIRVGTITLKPDQNVQARGVYDNGFWRVVFRRSIGILDKEIDAQFPSPGKKLCAFGVWNGSEGDRGGRKSISDWVELDIK